jgi:hypothetical protein
MVWPHSWPISATTSIELTPERLLDRIAEGLNIQQLLAVGVTPAKRSGMADRSPVQERQRFAPEPEEEGNGSLVKWGVGASGCAGVGRWQAYYIWNNTQSYSSANEESKRPQPSLLIQQRLRRLIPQSFVRQRPSGPIRP